jgi:transcriptional regulator with XRE-family HTH domain
MGLAFLAQCPQNGVDMKLSEYLEAQELSYAAFGRVIGTTGETVRRYVIGERIPDKHKMAKIALATGCKVTANDFFGIAA